MKAHARTKWVGYPVRKVRLVLDLIKGKDVETAANILKYTKNVAARAVEKTLKSSVANVVDQNRETEVDTSALFVTRLFADEGPTLKRISPRAQGRACRIRKRTSHIFIEVSTKE